MLLQAADKGLALRGVPASSGAAGLGIASAGGELRRPRLLPRLSPTTQVVRALGAAHASRRHYLTRNSYAARVGCNENSHKRLF